LPIRILIEDRTYSTTNRPGDVPNACEQANASKCQAFAKPAYDYGVASSCVEGTAVLGRANVDLRGTTFHILASEHGHLGGFQPQGQTNYLNDGVGLRKQAEVTGGGACGYGF